MNPAALISALAMLDQSHFCMLIASVLLYLTARVLIRISVQTAVQNEVLRQISASLGLSSKPEKGE